MRGAVAVNRNSYAAIFIEVICKNLGDGGESIISTASGFIVQAEQNFYLVTARHVVSGEHAVTGVLLDKDARRPDLLRLTIPGPGGSFDMGKIMAGKFVMDFPLYEPEDKLKESPLWVGHPMGRDIDVAVLRLTSLFFHQAWTLKLDLFNWPTLRDLYPAGSVNSLKDSDEEQYIPLAITDRLYIVGFPFGDTGTWPHAVWTSAPVASEPIIPWNNKPAFLVDARSRKGQSGAPVILYIRPSDIICMPNGDSISHGTTLTVLVGLYSGRVQKDSDLGMVWTRSAIREVIAAAESSVKELG